MTEERLIKLLKELRRIEPSQEAYDEGLNLFLQKAREKFNHNSVELTHNRVEHSTSSSFGFSGMIVQTKNFINAGLRAYASHFAVSVMITILVFGAFGAYSGMSARKALPDNKPLYTLKRALEKTQLTLSFSSTQKTAVRINHLERRVEELNHIAAKTKANPDKDGLVVAEAIRSTQHEINAVKEGLAEVVVEGQTDDDVTDLMILVNEKVNRYQIALNEVHEDLPEDIKVELEPEVLALSSAFSEISEVLDSLDKPRTTPGTPASPFDMGATTSDSVIILDTPTSSTITTTADFIDPDGSGESGIASTSTETIDYIPQTQPANTALEPEEEEFSIEKDTFEVRIGD